MTAPMTPAAEAVRERLIKSILIYIESAARDIPHETAALRCADAILADPLIGPLLAGSGGVPDGWKLVPIELTRSMKDEVSKDMDDAFRSGDRLFIGDLWADLLAAAPTPPAQDKTP